MRYKFPGFTGHEFDQIRARNHQPVLDKLELLVGHDLYSLFRERGIESLEFPETRNNPGCHSGVCCWAMLVPKGQGNEVLKPQLNVLVYCHSKLGDHVAVRLALAGRKMSKDTTYPLRIATGTFLDMDADFLNPIATEKGLSFNASNFDTGEGNLLIETKDFCKLGKVVTKYDPNYNAVNFGKRYPLGSKAFGPASDFVEEAFDILSHLYESLKDLFRFPDYGKSYQRA